jgi:hypothetical protein
MKEFYSDQDAFDKICGNVDPSSVSEDEIRSMADVWNEMGETCSDEMVEAAIRHISQ